MKIFETHAHYIDEAYDNDLEKVLERVKKAGVDKIIDVSYSIESSRKSVELSNIYDYMYTTIGIHPEEANLLTDNDYITKLEAIYNENKNSGKIVAIGEIGLDYHYEGYNADNQKNAFIEQIRLANRLSLPVVVHTRDAINDTYEILKNVIKPDKGLVFHCFSMSKLLFELGIENNWMFSFTGNITYQRSKKSIDIIKQIPIDNIMVETDCPYLTPEPYKGQKNSSEYLPIIIAKLSEIKEIDIEKVAQITYDNATNFFGLKQ